MAIFHSHVRLPEGISRLVTWDKHATLKKLLLLITEDIVWYIPYITITLLDEMWMKWSLYVLCWSAGARPSSSRGLPAPKTPRGWRWGVGKPPVQETQGQVEGCWNILKLNHGKKTAPRVKCQTMKWGEKWVFCHVLPRYIELSSLFAFMDKAHSPLGKDAPMRVHEDVRPCF